MNLRDRVRSIFDVHSRRDPDLQDDYNITHQLRIRTLILYRDATADQREFHGGNIFWRQMHRSLEYLLARSNLSRERTSDAEADVWKFLHICSTSEFFDFLELSFKLDVSRKVFDNDFVAAINEVFQVDGSPFRLTRIIEVDEEVKVGRRYGGTRHIRRVASTPKVIRVDDEVTYQEALKPALSALGAAHFGTANSEFLNAIEDYRKSDYSDCLTKCCSALESVLKVICDRSRWPYSTTDTAGPLLDTVIENSDLDSFFVQPLMLIATIRNRLSSSHGAGTETRTVDQHIAQFAVTSTAAAIVLLVRETEE